MINKKILPTYCLNKGLVKDGVVFKAHHKCLNSFNKKCAEYYSKIIGNEGIYTCPFGYTSVVKDKIIYTSFKLKNHYIKHKEQFNIFNPVIDQEQLDELIKYENDFSSTDKKLEESKIFVKDIVHEIRNLNAQIISKADVLTMSLQNINNKKKKDEWITLSRNILSLGELIETRYLCYDINVNPESLSIGGTKMTNVYKKFDKVRMCYNDVAKAKKINLKFSGSSDIRIEAYNSFELVPYLIIDNLIKYSIPDSDAIISFKTFKTNLIIEISSFGPYITKDEQKRLVEKGFRSEMAKKYTSQGNGIGLNLLKNICDIHNITLDISCEKMGSNTDYGKDCKIELGMFKLQLGINIDQ